MKYIKYVKPLFGVTVLILSLILIFIIGASEKNRNTEKAIANVEVMLTIWDETVDTLDTWQDEQITREDVAIKGNELLQKLNNLENVENNDAMTLDLEKIDLETRVMLFDMVRGFDLEGNEYKDKEKIAEETLAYVYPKRYKSFKNLYDNFLKLYDKK